MLYIGSDHGGFELKNDLAKFFKSKRIEFVDVGPEIMNPDDDYPLYSSKVAEKVSENPQNNLGLLMCRSGQGVCIAANKFKNVQAALAWNPKVAVAGRRDDNVNVLCLPSDYISTEVAEEIVDAWLSAEFSPEPRFQRRLDEIRAIEKDN